MKRRKPDPPRGWQLSAEAWRSLTDAQQDDFERTIEGAGGTDVPHVPPQSDAVATTTQSAPPDARPSKRRRQDVPASTQPDQDAPVVTAESLQQAMFGNSGSEFDDETGPGITPLVLGDAYIMAHGETAASGQSAVLEPGQVLSFYASQGKDLDFVDALRVLSGKNTQAKYTIRAGDGKEVPRLVLTPLTKKETGWAEDCSLGGKKVFFVDRPPLNGEELPLREELPLHEVLRLVRYQNVHIIACQGAAQSAIDVEKSAQSKEVGVLALHIIDSAGDEDNTPAFTLKYIRDKPPEDRAELMSIPLFEFFVERLENPVVGEIDETAAAEIKASIEKYSSESGEDKKMLDGLLWRALPESTRNALKDWDQGYWEPFDKLPPVSGGSL